MSTQSQKLPDGHLRYYEQHDISPVRYNTSDLDAHFDRRDSLYRALGLPPVAFTNARVLEIAPGSGQNSLYIAANAPHSFELVEPNPAGVRDIVATYDEFQGKLAMPKLHKMRFEDFKPETPFHIVLCENWLGSLPNEITLICKLATLVEPGGVLVMTTVPLSGFFPNIMRRLLALRLLDREVGYSEQTVHLVDVFGPHLATMENMTRSHSDWVRDCMLNPHYLNVALPLETVIDAIGDQMELLATFPGFAQDWRWFKELTGPARRFNQHTLDAFRENAHNFIDHRKIRPPRQAEENRALDEAFGGLHATALAWQTAFHEETSKKLSALQLEIGDLLAGISAELGAIDNGLAAAVEELRSVWLQPSLTDSDVRDMTEFGPLFGRETIYASFTRPCIR